MQSYNAVKCKYTSVYTRILEYMRVHMKIHELVKVYKVDIPGYTKIYSGIMCYSIEAKMSRKNQ